MRMPNLALILMLPALLVLAGCQTAQKSKVSVDYYSIKGNTTADLDREIRRKGPRVDGGRHAVAVARIKILPNITYSNTSGRCVVTKAKVSVDAKVTLPRWTGRKNASEQLGQAWDNIDRYTRLHESVHVAIAFRYAQEMENALLNLGSDDSCDGLKTRAKVIADRFLKTHDSVQKKFDRDEQKRFSRLVANRQGKV